LISATQSMQASAPYEVFALRYAENPAQPAARNFIDGDAHDQLMPLDYFIWLVRAPGRAYVIDTGFDAQAAKERSRVLLATPGELLSLLDVDSEQVSDVIVTHMHYDHAGNREAFGRARFHLQDREMAYVTGRCMCHPALSGPFDVRDVSAMVERVYAQRVAFHDGDHELAPGLSVHRLGGHTAGLQIVRVWTRRGWLVLASDASHFYANMEQGRGFPIVYNLGDMYEGHRRCYELADRSENVIPGHDPLVMKRYPPPHPSLQGKVARLDADPS
jgi:glyoxylase-like metal-dependent hydrolase (beta-lactamase superfamily II)